MASTTVVPGLRISRARRVAFAAVSVAAALVIGGTSLPALVVPWFQVGNQYRLQELGWGVFLGLVTSALLLQVRSPESRIALFQQLVAALAALLVAVTVADVVDPAPLIMAVVLLVVGALHPAREELHRFGTPSLTLAAAALLAAVPLVAYGLGHALLERGGPGIPADPDAGHRLYMAAVAFVLPLTGLVASLRAPGWRLAGWTAGLGGFLLGLAWLLLPAQASAPGASWGAVTMAGGAVFAGLCEWEARRAGIPIRGGR